MWARWWGANPKFTAWASCEPLTSDSTSVKWEYCILRICSFRKWSAGCVLGHQWHTQLVLASWRDEWAKPRERLCPDVGAVGLVVLLCWPPCNTEQAPKCCWVMSEWRREKSKPMDRCWRNSGSPGGKNWNLCLDLLFKTAFDVFYKILFFLKIDFISDKFEVVDTLNWILQSIIIFLIEKILSWFLIKYLINSELILPNKGYT